MSVRVVRCFVESWQDLRTYLWILAVAGIALATVIASNEVDLVADHLGIRVLDANWQFSWSHDLDKIALAVGSLAASYGGLKARSRRWQWWATAAILALFLLDELSALHAQIGQASFGKLLYSPILVGLVFSVWLLARDSPQRVIVGTGLATLFICFGVHVIGLRLLRPLGYYSVPYQAGVGIKEGMELAGLLLIVPALWSLAGGLGYRVSRGALSSS